MPATPGEISDEVRNQRAIDDRAKARDAEYEAELRREHYGPTGAFWANGPANPFDTFGKAA